MTEANLQSLTLDSWSFSIVSLTLYNLSREGDRFQNLTLQSLSLNDESGLHTVSFKEVSFEDGSLKELDKNLAHSLTEGGAETNSLPHLSVQERMLAQEAETNSFSESFSQRNLSLRMCLRIFLLCSFQLVCAALFLKTCSFTMSLTTESLQADQLEAAYIKGFDRHSLQQEELVTAYCRKSFEQQSFHQDELELACLLSPTRASQLSSFQQKKLSRESFDSFNQLDLEISLSLTWFGSTSFSYQLQADSFDRSSFELRALPCTAWFQPSDQRSFQLTSVQLTSLVQGGAFNIALQTRASSPPLHCPASTLTSLSLALVAWLKPSSKRAWRRSNLRSSLFTTALSTTSSHTSASMRALQPTSFRTTSSFRRTFPWFSFLLIIFFSTSFRGQEIEKENELLTTVLEQELEELLAHKSCSHGPGIILNKKMFGRISFSNSA